MFTSVSLKLNMFSHFPSSAFSDTNASLVIPDNQNILHTIRFHQFFTSKVQHTLFSGLITFCSKMKHRYVLFLFTQRLESILNRISAVCECSWCKHLPHFPSAHHPLISTLFSPMSVLLLHISSSALNSVHEICKTKGNPLIKFIT